MMIVSFDLLTQPRSYEAYRFSAYYTPIHKLYPHLVIVSSTIAIEIPDGAVGGYHRVSHPRNSASIYVIS